MKNQIKFNNVILDLVTRQLYIDGQIVHLQKKSFDLLDYLIVNRERAVSKDELLDKLWERDYASENVLAHATSKLRTALNDNNKKGSVIRTVHGFGLQFVAKINHTPSKKSKLKLSILISCFFMFAAFILVKYYFNYNTTNTKQIINNIETPSINQPKLRIINDNLNNDSDNWKVNGITAYLNQLFSYSDIILPIDILQDDENIEERNNKKLNVDNIINAKQINNTLYLTYIEKGIIRSQFEVNVDDMSVAVAKVNNWICHHTLIENNLCNDNIKQLSHNDNFIIENYIRGQNALKNHQTKEAINFFEICLQQDEDFVLSRIALAQSQYRISNYNEAIAQSLSVIKTTSNPLLKSQSQLVLGKSYYRLSELDKAKDIFNQLITDSNIIPIAKGMALLELTKIDKDNLDLETALVNAKEAEKIFDGLKLPVKIAQSKEMMGDINITKGELNKANELLTQSLRIYEKMNDALGMHNVSASLGTVNRRLGNYSAAFEFAKQRLDMALKINDPINIIGAHSQMAYSLIELGNLGKALQHANKMTKLALAENEINTLYFAYVLEAEISNSMNNFTLALDKNKQALSIAKDIKQVKKQIETLCFMGDIAINNKLYKEADQYLDECLQLSISNDYLLFKAVSQLYLATLHSQLEDIPKAIVFLEQSLIHAKLIKNDKLFNEIYLEFYNLNKYTSITQAEKYLDKIPESYKNNYPYLISSAERYFLKNQFKKALELALKAKHIANEMWLSENQLLLEKILDKVNNQ